jgi:hypothetical protein
MSKIESHDIRVSQTPSTIVVYIGWTFRDHPPPIFGGDASYTLDRKKFTILQRELYK